MQILDVVPSSVDETVKLVFSDDNFVYEVSYINKEDGKDILCVPTQTSCKLGCQFCHLTGLGVEVRNLSIGTITELVQDSIQRLNLFESGNRTLLISYMGAGEPLMNVDGVIGSAECILQESHYETTRFAVATLIPGEKPFREFTRRVKESGLNFKLHWSLHSVDQEARKTLMPAALDLKTSAALVSEYAKETGRPVEIHYTPIADVNDRPEDVDLLSALALDRNITIKLLRFSPREEVSLHESERVGAFEMMLYRRGFSTEVYAPPGRDIGSSCGQFRLDHYYEQIKKPGRSLPVVPA